MTSTGPEEELNDAALLEEIDLLADLVVAAGSADRPLTGPEVDLALGLHPQPVRPPGVEDVAAAS